MSADMLVSLEATTTELLGRAASIGSLSAEDRAELDGLAGEAAQARSAHESVMDTRAGVRMYVELMQGLIARAHHILGKYGT